ncbi:MAG: hypothetical protein ACR2IF_01370 [Terriglobales bacterium]
MKKVLWLLAVTVAFTLTSVAQTSSSSMGQSSSSGMGQTDTGAKKGKKSAGTTDQSGAMASDKSSGKAKKEATLTGCLSADGATLSNAKHKEGVAVGPADKVKDHAGHQVALKGEWSADKKTFNVASVKHLSDTCKEAPGGGTAGMTKKGKKDTSKGKTDTATPPKQ